MYYIRHQKPKKYALILALNLGRETRKIELMLDSRTIRSYIIWVFKLPWDFDDKNKRYLSDDIEDAPKRIYDVITEEIRK